MIVELLLILITFGASCIGTISGFGVGTIMTPLLLFFMPFPSTIFVTAIIHWFHDIWRVILFKGKVDWYLFLFFGFPAVLMSVVGAQFLFFPPTILLPALGIFLMVYACILLFFPHIRIPEKTPYAMVGGSLAGFFAGVFGIRGAVSSMFLSAFDLRKAVYLSTVGAISFMIDTTRVVAYLYEGIRLPAFLSVVIYFMVLASFAGSWIGSRVVHLIPQEHFRRVVALFLILAGARLLFVG